MVDFVIAGYTHVNHVMDQLLKFDAVILTGLGVGAKNTVADSPYKIR